MNDFFRLLSTLFIGILVGYTIQPVPKWLNNLFDNSNIFKFILIFINCIISTYPIDTSKIINSFISSVIILVIFFVFRYMDKKDKIDKIEEIEKKFIQ